MKKYTLRELRKKNKMTLAEVGKKMGDVSKTTIYQWENGWRVPSLPTIEMFLKIYKVKFEQVDWRPKKK